MKKIILLTTVVVFAAMLQNCEDFLEKAPLDTISTDCELNETDAVALRQVFVFGVLELDGAGAAAAADHAHRDLVAALVLDDDLAEISVEDLAGLLAEREIDDGGGDEGVFAVVVDGDGDTRQLEAVVILVERAAPAFDDSEQYLRETHAAS